MHRRVWMTGLRNYLFLVSWFARLPRGGLHFME